MAQACPAVASGPATVPLVELYTSEGCNSCPPADRWLSRFQNPGPSRVVAVAFHVDYWDYLGWKDRFADPRHAERQRESALRRRSTAVYTPQVVLAGRDSPRWHQERDFAAALETVGKMPARAGIRLQWLERGFAELQVEPLPAERRENLALVVVTLESGLESRVAAVENRGEVLRHDFVVRALETHTLAGNPKGTFRQRFTIPAGGNPERMSLALFVQDTRTGDVLQALAAPYCR